MPTRTTRLRVLAVVAAPSLCAALAATSAEHAALAPAAMAAPLSSSGGGGRSNASRHNGTLRTAQYGMPMDMPMDDMPMDGMPMPMSMPNNSGAGASMSSMMPMYFRAAPTDLALLFGGWRPQSAAEYALSLVAIFLVAFFSEWLRSRANRLLVEPFAPAPADGKGEATTRSTCSIAAHRLLHFLLVALRLVAAFCLMLLVMTYDIGIFIVVILGLAGGHVVWADPRSAAPGAHAMPGLGH